jgi:hypothetical protein
MSEPTEETRDELIDRMDKQIKLAKKRLKELPEGSAEYVDASARIAHAERDLRVFVTPTPPDGFRERKVRPKGWLKSAMADGSVFDPDKPAPTPIEAQLGDLIVAVPTARVTVLASSPE